MDQKRRIPLIFVLLGLGILYLIWLRWTGYAIPCMVRKITGLLCPGCGITGMLMSLIQLDFRNAYHANPFLFTTGPFLMGELIYDMIQRKRRKKLPVWNERLLILYAVGLCVFGVWRNL